MKRRDLFIVSIFILIGIFCWLNFSAKADSDFELIIPINNGSAITNESGGWQYSNCVSGGNFIGMRTSTSQIISPTIDLSDYASAKMNFEDRTYYGSGDSAKISIFISEDDGNSWQNVYFHLPTTSAMTITSDFLLNDYLSKQIKIKFQTASATGYKGAGITNISILGVKNIIPPTNTPPYAIIHSSSTGYLDEEIEFDASSSTDDENNLATYYWNFGDSSSSEEIIASHIFPAIGDYLISLTVTDTEGASSTATTSINILNIETVSTTTSTTSSTIPIIYNLHDLVINEFLSDPATSSEKEWVELYNNTTSTIDLSGWTMSDNSSTSTMSGFISATDTDRFFVFEFSSSKLNNDGDIITLKDPTGQIIDQIIYGNYGSDTANNTLAPDKGNSTARIADGVSSSTSKNDFTETITVTKGLPNTITLKPISSGGGSYATPKPETTKLDPTTTTPTTTVEYSDQIIINEILPRPSLDEKNNEFIELINLSTSSVDLAGWILGDNSTNKYILPLDNPASTTITTSSPLTIKRSDSKIALNNSGVEAVKLYSPDDKLVDLVEYKGPVEKDYSYSRDEKGNFQWTNSPTPGQENTFSSSTPDDDTPDDSNSDSKTNNKTTSTAKTAKTTTKTATVKVAKIETPARRVDLENISSLNLNDKVITQGIVSVEPGVLGTQIFYLAGSGIQVYCNKKDFPNLKVGDFIEVDGILSEASGERRIKITGQDNIKIINQGQNPEIHSIATSEVGEDSVGSLAKITGVAVEVKGNYIYLDDGSEEAKIYIKSSTGINLKDLNIKPGDNLEVTGIVANASGGYRLLPRYANDIKKIGEVKGDFAMSTSTENGKNQSQSWKYFSAVIIFLSIIIGWLGWKIKSVKIEKNK
ncbi:MAG: lamin tail domain-containing protein [Patescibacteria group bacterium]|jgi:DNA/RNA endonuclease YhcR with UshA esterase domain